MKNSFAYIFWIAFWNLWRENWTLLIFNYPGKCYVCSSSSCAVILNPCLHFVYSSYAMREVELIREQGICCIIDIYGFAAPHLFSFWGKPCYFIYLEKSLLCDFLSHRRQISRRIPRLTTVINSGIGTWAQSFFSTTQCFSKRDILFLHVLPVCVYVSISFHVTFLHMERDNLRTKL